MTTIEALRWCANAAMEATVTGTLAHKLEVVRLTRELADELERDDDEEEEEEMLGEGDEMPMRSSLGLEAIRDAINSLPATERASVVALLEAFRTKK